MADPSGTSDPTTAELLTRLTDQSRQLVRDELRLAQAETQQKVKHGVMGLAELGIAGVLALYGVGLLLATIVLGLDAALDRPWLSALIVTVVVFLGVAVAALLGKREVGEATPPAPERAVAGLKQDVDTLKGNA